MTGTDRVASTDALRERLQEGVKLLRTVYGSKAVFASHANEWVKKAEASLAAPAPDRDAVLDALGLDRERVARALWTHRHPVDAPFCVGCRTGGQAVTIQNPTVEDLVAIAVDVAGRHVGTVYHPSAYARYKAKELLAERDRAVIAAHVRQKDTGANMPSRGPVVNIQTLPGVCRSCGAPR